MRQLGTSSTTRFLADRAGRAQAGTDTRRRVRFSTFGGAAAHSWRWRGNALVRGAQPQVAAESLSYPLSAQAFQLGQVFFALTQVLMALEIIALAPAGDWRSRPRRVVAPALGRLLVALGLFQLLVVTNSY